MNTIEALSETKKKLHIFFSKRKKWEAREMLQKLRVPPVLAEDPSSLPSISCKLQLQKILHPLLHSCAHSMLTHTCTVRYIDVYTYIMYLCVHTYTPYFHYPFFVDGHIGWLCFLVSRAVMTVDIQGLQR